MGQAPAAEEVMNHWRPGVAEAAVGSSGARPTSP